MNVEKDGEERIILPIVIPLFVKLIGERSSERDLPNVDEWLAAMTVGNFKRESGGNIFN